MLEKYKNGFGVNIDALFLFLFFIVRQIDCSYALINLNIIKIKLIIIYYFILFLLYINKLNLFVK